MAGGEGGRSLEETPTWAVAIVCFVLVAVSIVIEHIIHLIGKWLKKKHKRALYESLEKVKSVPLMILSELIKSLLVWCMGEELMLLGFISLLLTVGQGPISNICIPKKVGATWHPCNKEEEGKRNKSDDSEDEGRRRRLLALSNMGSGGVRRVLAAAGEDKCAAKGKVPFVSADGIHQLHIFIFVLAVFHVLYCVLTMALGRAKVCFFRQFVRSVPKVDYMTLRHGFITVILLVGTKLQVIITKMALRIQERGEVVKGVPVVQPGDDLFWFNRPRLTLYLINFVLFQILCSYVTLPLYALVTQMGSTMKSTIFNERVATALRNWHHTAKKHIKHNKQSGQGTPMSSRGTTPSHYLSPVHLLRHYRSEIDSSFQTSPRKSNFDNNENWDTEESPSPNHFHQGVELAHVERDIEAPENTSAAQVAPLPETATLQHEIDVHDFTELT
ncbi:hypothetical protein RJ639_047663 [Escallonia herrerae]|uniref:MLO-like protein n=1 Tax=Escallonia herrerae TaxID=1293975 RepID=A0AA88WAH8_9ASTE|nr:hypothetical protein RJ639_047663 [Escallonia herrerae]